MTPPAEPIQDVARALRTAASRAAEAAGGGLSLVFATEDENGGDVRLRSAAGFAAPADARAAAAALAPHLRGALTSSMVLEIPSEELPLGIRAAAGLRIHPVRTGVRVHGVVAVGSPEKPTDEQNELVAEIVQTVAVHLDRVRLERECADLRAELARGGSGEGDHSEEVLRLSEALFAQDIELLRSTEKLGKIERLKNDFIEKMSRELRTPLNSIIEGIISVLTGEDEALSESAKATLRSALDEGSAFLRTLQNILDLWKIKQGELPVECQDVNFRELVDEAIFSVQDSLEDKPLRIETELVEPFPRLRTDLPKLSQILFLLLDNAAKFTPEGAIKIRGRVADGRLMVSIQDDGIGICHDDLQFVFDEFFQVDESSSQKYRGAGLGLTLVRDLIALLEGEVSIQSDIGRGTTVSFSIPMQNA